MVFLVWSTNAYQSPDLSVGLPSCTFTNHYRRTEDITHLIRVCVMWGYNGLELVVYGAVELGYVVLFFVGEQGLFGLEVYTRLGWHFD